MSKALPLEVSDFSGGITDNYLAGDMPRYQKADNLLVSNNKKLFMCDGSQIEDLVNSQIPSGVQRIGAFIEHRSVILRQQARNIYYISGGTYNTLTGPSGNPALGSGTNSNYISKSFWNNHTIVASDSFCSPQKIYKDNSGVLQVRTAGMPAMAAPTLAGTAGTGNYIYAFYYSYSYSVENVLFEDRGPTVQVAINNINSPNVNSITVSAIPVIANGVTENYDTTIIVVKIFRSQNNGTTFNFLGQVTNGTTSYVDSATDASITNNAVIYTAGGVVDNDPPPQAKFVHITNDFCIYAHVKESGTVFSNKIRQSIKGDFDSCPASFFDFLEDDITGVSSVQGVPIVLCSRSVYRIDGFFDSLGRGGLTHLKINDTVGCVSHNSIVQTVMGIFFAGQEAFYFCDGYKVSKISDQFNTTYQSLVATATQKSNIYGAYDKANLRVWWALQANASSNENDSCFIFDLRWGVKPDGCFTTTSGAANYRPTAIHFFNGLMYRADSRGYVFTHSSLLSTHPRVDTLSAPSTWGTSTIIYNYKSVAFNFGTSFVRKWVPWILLTLENRSNVSVQINSINDDGKSTYPLVEIRYRNNQTWGDPDVVWGDLAAVWNFLGLIEQKRRFPARSLRCNYKQIQITNSNTVITNSDTLGTATIDTTAKTATISAASAFPVASLDYSISFANDSYAHQYLITAVSGNVVTFADPTNMAPPGAGNKWMIRGTKKGEQVGIVSYVVHYMLGAPSQRTFHGAADTGANA